MRRFFRRIALYAFHVLFARPLLNWIVGVRYRGRSRLPDGPCLVVANHNSHLDAAVLMTLFPLRRLPSVHPVAAADYFGSNWFMNMMAMLFMNGIPIERKPRKGLDPLAPVVDRLNAGDSLVFFPEGSRGEAGVVARFRPGIGVLVRSVPGLLVVPVFLSGPERIWPRGHAPVPLSIDAHVGRPRSYDATLEPREIADRVRADVLALAPPPPPVPGPRAEPPLRVAICGVDPASRTPVVQATTARLGHVGRTLGVSDSTVVADAEGVREAPGPVPVGPSRVWLGLLAAVFRTGGRFKGERFSRMVERAQLDEALDHGRDTRFLVIDGSAIVDLLASAEADFYRGVFDDTELHRLMQYLSGERRIPLRRWWSFVRRAPEVWLISAFDLARPPVPDVLVHLISRPADVMARLRSAGRPLEPHENEAFLERLQEAYRHVGSVLDGRRRMIRLEIDANGAEPDEIAARIAAVCTDRGHRSATRRAESRRLRLVAALPRHRRSRISHPEFPDVGQLPPY